MAVVSKTNPQIRDNQAPVEMFQFLTLDAGLPPLLSSRLQGWEGLVVEQRHHPACTLNVPPLSAHLVTIYNGSICPIVQKRDGRNYKDILKPGDISIVPVGTESYWSMDGNTDVLNIDLTPAFVQKVATECNLDSDQVELVNHFGVRDPHIEHLSFLLRRELETNSLGGRLLGESLGTALTVYLLRQYSSTTPHISTYTGGLAKADLQRAIEYIHDNLDADLSLADLAEVVNLSQFHFTRLFKQSTGLSPHQYVIRVRVEEAKRLLSTGTLSVGEVASRVGFAHQSHLASHMRRLLGVTPKTILQDSKNLSKVRMILTDS